MVKRCIIQPPIIRVSRPGVDVDGASRQQCLLHEDKLFAQPYFQAVVNKPAGSEFIAVDIPAMDADPIVFTFPYYADGQRSKFPFPRSYSKGNSQSGYPNIEYFSIRHRVLSMTQIQLQFASNSRFPPVTACYLLLLRRPQ